MSAVRGEDFWIDELEYQLGRPLTPKGRDCLRTWLRAFAAHVTRAASRPPAAVAEGADQPKGVQRQVAWKKDETGEWHLHEGSPEWCQCQPVALEEARAAAVPADLREALTCRYGAPHYCPNCGRDIGPELLDAAPAQRHTGGEL